MVVRKCTTSSDHRHDSNNDTVCLRRSEDVEIRPQSGVAIGSTLYSSPHLTFSQLCLQADGEPTYSFEPSYPDFGQTTIGVSRPSLQRSIKAGGRGSVVQVVGSQLVTVLKDDRKTIRRSTLSAITQKFTEKKRDWMDEIDLGMTSGDSEALAKRREHRTKAESVLALLQLEQEAMEKEEQEERARYEQVSKEKTGFERDRMKTKIRLELNDLAAYKDGEEQSEGEKEEKRDWSLYHESITSSKWAWDGISNQGLCYREEMRVLVSKFEEADAKVWGQIIHRHKYNCWSNASCIQRMESSDGARHPFVPLTNSRLRGATYEILRLRAKRQNQLNECAEVQNRWQIKRAPYISS